MWQPESKYKYLYTPVSYNGTIYWHRKDKLKAKKYFAEVVKYENRELPKSIETKKKDERASMAKFLRTGKF